MRKNKTIGFSYSLIFILVLYLSVGCNSIRNSKSKLLTKEVVLDSIAPRTIVDANIFQKYVDSLNAVKNFQEIPRFLYNSCIDGNVLYWTDLHHPSSIRKQLIDNTYNIKLLEYIVEKRLFDTLCNSKNPNRHIPFFDVTLLEMCKNKLDSLRGKN